MRFFGSCISFLTSVCGMLFSFWGGLVLGMSDIRIWADICWGLFGLSLAWFAVSAVFCMVQAARYRKNNQLAQLLSMADKIKFGTVPFFILRFLLWLAGLGILMIATRGTLIFSLPAVLPVLIGVTYILMLAASWFTVNALILARKRGLVTNAAAAYGIIAQAIFVLDVVLWFISRRKIKKTWGGDRNGLENKYMEGTYQV